MNLILNNIQGQNSPIQRAQDMAKTHGHHIPSDMKFLTSTQFVHKYLGHNIAIVTLENNDVFKNRDFYIDQGYSREALFQFITFKFGDYDDAVKALGFDHKILPEPSYLIRFISQVFPEEKMLYDFPVIQQMTNQQQGLDVFDDQFLKQLVNKEKKVVQSTSNQVNAFNEEYEKLQLMTQEHLVTYEDALRNFKSFKAQLDLFVENQATASYIRFLCNISRVKRFPFIYKVLQKTNCYKQFDESDAPKAPKPIQNRVYGFDGLYFDIPKKKELRSLRFKEDFIEEYMDQVYSKGW